MKPYLPHNILFACTIVAVGLIVVYNLGIREDYATTLQYHYPERESEVISGAAPEPEPYRPPGEESSPEPTESESAVQVVFPLDINTATIEQLKLIPQVGDVTAQRIVQYREELGGYTDLAQLMDIKGVGEQTYEHLFAYLVIQADEASAPEE